MSRADIEQILESGAVLKRQRGDSQHKPLAGRIWALIFSKSSTRTRVSFEVGIARLGGEDEREPGLACAGCGNSGEVAGRLAEVRRERTPLPGTQVCGQRTVHIGIGVGECDCHGRRRG